MKKYAMIEKLTLRGIALLQDERKAILSGDYAAMEKLNPRKDRIAREIEKLSEGLGAAGATEEALRGRKELRSLLDILSRRGEENQRLLTAARDGALTARRRIETIMDPDAAMGVYGPGGAPLGTPRTEPRSFRF